MQSLKSRAHALVIGGKVLQSPPQFPVFGEPVLIMRAGYLESELGSDVFLRIAVTRVNTPVCAMCRMTHKAGSASILSTSAPRHTVNTVNTAAVAARPQLRFGAALQGGAGLPIFAI